MRIRNVRTEFEFDNRWVVPYNPALLKEFKCHLNVEICATIKAIKYVIKYLLKGSDMAAYKVAKNNGAVDEISQYLTGRYIGPSEAVCTILGFDLHDRFPSVVRLPVHLPDDEIVFFTAENAEQVAESPKATMLTAFFTVSDILLRVQNCDISRESFLHLIRTSAVSDRRNGQAAAVHGGEESLFCRIAFLSD